MAMVMVVDMVSAFKLPLTNSRTIITGHILSHVTNCAFLVCELREQLPNPIALFNGVGLAAVNLLYDNVKSS